MTQPTLEQQLVDSLLIERRRERKWRNIRFFIILAFVILYSMILFIGPSIAKAKQQLDSSKGYVALIRMNGEIMAGKDFSARHVLPELNAAFRDKKAKAVVLEINSPGGSPVQAGIIHDKIEQLKHKFHKPVVVLGVDALASGAYLIATAADKIYVHNDTITGSIGVVMAGFGFVDTIKKLGITRRVYTAGVNKHRLDPFEPVSANSQQKIATILAEAHQNFIQYVLEGRAGKLHGNKKTIFSGDFWLGQSAVRLGLVDGTGNLWTILDDNFQVSQYKDYTRRPSLLNSVIKGFESKVNFALVNHSQLTAEM